MSDINFVDVDINELLKQIISGFEIETGETLYPGDERRIFIQNILPVIVGLKSDINLSGRQNLLRYASGDKLDALGDFYDVPRLPAQKSTCTIQFTLSAAQSVDVVVPAGTRVTPDGVLYFATVSALTITAGQTTGTVTAEATVAGKSYDGLTSGQIKTIVDPVPYVASASNTTTTSGGSDIETDDNYRERIRLAPESYSVAGPEGAYIYWAMTADSTIADVTVSSPSAGAVQIVVLLDGGQIPTQAILDKVTAAVSEKNRRPLTDNVSVIAPTTVSYNITLTYYISKGNQASEASIRTAIENSGGAVDQYKAWQCAKLGQAINPDELRYRLMAAGASRMTITAPTYAAVDSNKVAAAGTVSITYGGLE